MKRIFLLLLLLQSLTACTTDDDRNLVPDAKKPAGSTVPVEEALGELYAAMEAISADTRSGEAFDTSRAIRGIEVSGASDATRSEGLDLPDTMAYVVHFTDDKGFAVLGAQRTMEPVYAITEAGSFDARKLNAALAARVRQLDGKETHSEEGAAEIGTDYAYLLLADAMTVTPRIRPVWEETTYGEWQTDNTIGPLVEVKWNQTYPFNMNMPESASWNGSNYKGRYPVGCGIIAAAQMMSRVRKPILAPGVSASYGWTGLNSISTYANLNAFKPTYSPDQASADVRNYVGQLADVLYHLGVCFHASYGPDGTGVYTSNVVAALKKLDPTYYADAAAADVSTNMTAIYTSLDSGKPMFMQGWSNSGGHAWVLDGYLNRSRTVTYSYQMGFTSPIQTSTRTEHSKLLHFNWGYQGKYDGYFAEGVVDMNQRVSKDPVIDALTPDYNGSANYSTSNSVILY